MSSKAATVVRQSQGTDDSMSLEEQRERVTKLANSLADEVHEIDLGVYTGFSIHMNGPDEDRIDTHPEIEQLLEDLKDQRYDYLCALDDTRLSRDQFYWEIKRAAIIGDCELRFVLDVPDDQLTFRVQRAVESQVKMNEMKKAQASLDRRLESGCYQGRPPTGLKFAADKCHLEKGDRWDDVMEVFDLLDKDKPYSTVEAETGFSPPTISRMNERGRAWYEGKLAEYAREAEKEHNLPADTPG